MGIISIPNLSILCLLMDGDTVKVSVSVKYLDQKTKAAQISQFDLKLQKTGGNWKIVG